MFDQHGFLTSREEPLDRIENCMANRQSWHPVTVETVKQNSSRKRQMEEKVGAPG